MQRFAEGGENQHSELKQTKEIELQPTTRTLIIKTQNTSEPLTDPEKAVIQAAYCETEADLVSKKDADGPDGQSQNSSETIAENSTKEEGPPKRSFCWTLAGIVMLTCSMLGGSFIGPSANLLATKNTWLKIHWALALRVLILVPLVLAEIAFSKKGAYAAKIRSGLTRQNVIGMLLCPGFQVVWVFGLVFGSENMIQSHAYVCNTLFCVFTVLIGYCLRLKPLCLELIGLAVTVCGVVAMFSDPSAERTDGKSGTFLIYAACIGASCLASFYFLINGILVKALPPFTLLLIQSTMGFLIVTVILLATSAQGEFEFFSMHPVTGAFGYLDSDKAVETILGYGSVAGFWGNPGYVICLLFYSPVVISAVYLTEPTISQLFGFWLGIDELPGWLTWLGAALVVVGISFIQRAERQRKNENLQKVSVNSVLPTSEKQSPSTEAQKEESEGTAAIRRKFILSQKNIKNDQNVR